MNVIHKPLWPIGILRVCPPYLHILLGIVKKHHDLLKDDCHVIDLQIAEEMAKADENTTEEEECQNISLFNKYVNKLREIKKVTDDWEKKKEKCKFEARRDDLDADQKEDHLKKLNS